MADLAQLYGQHIKQLQQKAEQIIERAGLDGLAIHSGQPHRQFLDDMDYPFKCNPHFKAWAPLINHPHCWLLIEPNCKPKLYFYQPVDFWHKVESLPEAFWVEHFEISFVKNPTEISSYLPYDLENYAYIGEHIDVAGLLGFKHFNPEDVMNYFHYHRVTKSEYEIACLEKANEIAVKGHQAASAAFFLSASEYEINQQYLAAINHTENEVPYTSIIALNEHSAILHYMALERKVPAKLHSFLIDAGANFNGYAADITRTYAHDSGTFEDMIEVMHKQQLELMQGIKAGVSFVDLHLQMHQRIANMLLEFGLSTGQPEDLIELGVTKAFFPHGLGHMLGLQVHDAGGFLHDDKGTFVSSPDDHPFLRCSRTLQANQVITIEPGLYIIDSLLNGLSENAKKAVNWQQVDLLKPFGGIRIEDNIVVTATGHQNLTRKFGLNDG
ncbi:Xaa-Pro dipeptidase [Paraferrimonas sp. SM1919]|uniref:Xaa-Pro dipeptidase n=1 Tax=Paraferrimonas sp. SM1919 TaxID=2662263 RepID=UPI0013D74C91|nr:Xaa-Pro dipeptidase [Paraferrimonas sp. SM1919]